MRDTETREDARTDYAAAVDLWTTSSDELWNKFNALLVTNSILLAVGSLALTNMATLAVVAFGLPIFGIVFSAVWWAAIRRAFAYLFYYVDSARQIEEEYLRPTVRTVSRGASLAPGGAVRFKFKADDEPKEHRMGPLARRVPARLAAGLANGMFFVLYVLMLLQAFLNAAKPSPA